MTLLDLARREAWRDDAACRHAGPGFFDSKIHDARKLCNVCPVRGTCLAYALGNNLQHGPWGGKSERERRKMIRPTYPYDRLVKALAGANTEMLTLVRQAQEKYLRDLAKRRRGSADAN